jgi:hypothetical protein
MVEKERIWPFSQITKRKTAVRLGRTARGQVGGEGGGCAE